MNSSGAAPATGVAPAALDATFASLHHDGSARYVTAVGGGDASRLEIGDQVRLRVRAAHDAPIGRMFVRWTPDGEERFEPLREAVPGPASRWWEGTLPVSMPRTRYRFLVETPDGHQWLNARGVLRAAPTDRDDFVLLAGHQPPRWLADRVFYQVFPERFANGDPSNDVTDGSWTYRGHPARRRRWDEMPDRQPGAFVDFFGGDLVGIEQRLDHVADLGVNALYLNPIFDARSYHGYDTIDYGRVAPHLGGDEALASLRRATRERDIRLILDIAPNHVGIEHPWFRRAQADGGSRSAEFFVFHEHPDEYESWLGVRSLPKLDYRSAVLRDVMYRGPDAVLRRWLREPFAIDGWRIDVANMLGQRGPDQLGDEVARGIRQAVKEESPDAYLVGEHWFDATDQLSGDRWDGVMNYAGFMMPVLGWLVGHTFSSHGSGTVLTSGPSTTGDLVETLTGFRAAIPWPVAAAQLNLLGSHDTPRIRSVVDDAGRLRAAFGLLLTYVGVPCIYYGDEVGLAGTDDAAARRPMPWDASEWDTEVLGFVRALVGVRRASPALQAGGFQLLEGAEDTLAFLRDTAEESVVVVVNRGPGVRPAGPLLVRHGAVADGTRFEEVLTRQAATVANGSLPLPATPPGVAVWRGATG